MSVLLLGVTYVAWIVSTHQEVINANAQVDILVMAIKMVLHALSTNITANHHSRKLL